MGGVAGGKLKLVNVFFGKESEFFDSSNEVDNGDSWGVFVQR